MVWSLIRRRRAASRLPVPGRCTPGRHVLATERLLLFTPRTRLDVAAAVAASADAEAQRWLGTLADEVVPDPGVRRALLAWRPAGDDGRRIPRELAEPYAPGPDDPLLLVCVRRSDLTYAGALELQHVQGEMGGWLAPGCRGRGLGGELFRAGVELAHTHLGLATIRAGAEPGNTASRGALARAGFVPDEGPPRHTLSDGRVIDALWHRNDTAAPSRCPALTATD
ncbi:GNAT family N-acetyltransferase [Streptomyces actinomycinicus]|uniref:GNAT family N-acetyltransferase n=1 Tax=Streptomyces actinomycinicus TaxID=1695166 RepID=A0A937ELP9_9ACTN|nr:GNAT family protein [Streptomyces actinomycinicus]MBL1084335.1 GNAT family N-acetyltransferase [Streptomyces actinomycinicus]